MGCEYDPSHAAIWLTKWEKGKNMEQGKLRRWLVPVVMIVSVVLMGCYLCRLQGEDSISDAKLKDVTAAVTKTLDTKAMQESDAQMIKRLYGLNPADYEGITLYYPVTNMDAEELLIVQLKDVSQQETVKAAIDARLETQKNSFEGYGVEQYALLEKSVVDVEGNYILFVVNEQAAKAQSAFLQAL